MKKKTIRLMMLLIIPALFASCSQPPEVIPGYEGTRLNPDFLADIETVSALMTAAIQGDKEGMELYLHENYSSSGDSGGNTQFSKEEAIEGWVRFAEQNDNAKFSNRIWYSWVVDEMESNPDLVGKWVVNWYNASFRNAEGKEVSFPMHSAWRIREGKVDYSIHYYDRLYMMRQLGYQLQWPEPAEE